MEDESRYEKALGGKLLASVSRSFHLTLKALPAALREPISLAYLLARTADTVADTASVKASVRLEVLETFSKLVQGTGGDEDELVQLLEHQFRPKQEDEAEALLMARLREALAWLRTMSGARLDAVRAVLTPIIQGQTLDIQRFPADGRLRSLETAAELEDYTWLVAGCVGEFWTGLCFTELEGAFDAAESEEEMKRLGVSYGKGLQLVNILRDLKKDALLGRCYFPAEQWRPLGLTESRIAEDPGVLRPVWSQWLERATDLLEDGVRYICRVRHGKLRYATALPVLLGIRTLALLKGADDSALLGGVKISRVEVGKILLQASLANTPDGLRRLAQKLSVSG